MNIETEKFHKDLINLINDSQLPVGVVYYVMKDCLNDVAMAYNKSLLNNSEKDNKNEETENEEINEEKLNDESSKDE